MHIQMFRAVILSILLIVNVNSNVNRSSFVSTVAYCEVDDYCSIPGRGPDLFLCHCEHLLGPPVFLSCGYQALFPLMQSEQFMKLTSV